LAQQYNNFFAGSEFTFITEPEYAKSNYWLNAIICPNSEIRETFIKETNAQGVMTRPIWKLMHSLPMFQNAKHGPLPISEWIESCLVNIPSSPVNNG
jgi:dTDP-4-amino-4,6-dideoxygalactose transaminase